MKWLVLVLLLLMIPVTVNLGQKAQKYLTEAAVVLAEIKIDAKTYEGFLPRIWEGVAQGGELEADRKSLVSIKPVTGKLASLGIKYIRLDHVLDRPVDERMGEIREIRKVGGIPIISISYFPTEVAKTDTSQPFNWGLWQERVADLVRRVSGNTAGVYYEIWNEPDGKDFGNMSPEQYLTLYKNTLAGINRAGNVLPFKIGGPALANPDKKDWLRKFVELADKEDLRMDFISWHRYHREAAVFIKDLDMVEIILGDFPRYSGVEKLVTEWGSDSGANAVHGTNYDAAHLAAVTRALMGRVTLAVKFEARDGTGNNGLGLFTYDGGDKPTANVMKLLAKMKGQRIYLTGEGSNVTGFATRDGDKVWVLLANYDRRGWHTEEVPVGIKGLTAGKWNLKKTMIDGYNFSGRTEEASYNLPAGEFSFAQIMLPNSVLLLELILDKPE